MSPVPEMVIANGDTGNHIAAGEPERQTLPISEPAKARLDPPPSSFDQYALPTRALRADSALRPTTDVAPPLHLSSTFRYCEDPDELLPVKDAPPPTHSNPGPHVYSRLTAPTSSRLEILLTSLVHAPALTYTSGLSAIYAAYTALNPKRAFITGGYHGAHGVLALHTRLSGLEVHPLAAAPDKAQSEDVIHLETPLNPTGEARNVAYWSGLAKEKGAVLLVDATFAPPPLLDPFAWGADVVMHSGTKYFGGHSDLLLGVLATRRTELWQRLSDDRVFLGSVPGAMEGWLGVRSIRTLGVRIERQSQSAGRLVNWLNGLLLKKHDGDGEDKRCSEVLKGVLHASLQKDDMAWLQAQMPNGFGPVFALTLQEEWMARRFPSKLRLFEHATSLGGVESLIEWRAMSDAAVDPCLLRVSVGLEAWEDLRGDLLAGLLAIAGEKREKKEKKK